MTGRNKTLFMMLDCSYHTDGRSISYECFGCPALDAWNDTDNGMKLVDRFCDLGPNHTLRCNIGKCYDEIAKYLIDLAAHGDDDAFDLISSLIDCNTIEVLDFLQDRNETEQ